jgi:hypothetical protein
LFPTLGGEACAIASVEKHIADRIINNLIINSSSPPAETDLLRRSIERSRALSFTRQQRDDGRFILGALLIEQDADREPGNEDADSHCDRPNPGTSLLRQPLLEPAFAVTFGELRNDCDGCDELRGIPCQDRFAPKFDRTISRTALIRSRS